METLIYSPFRTQRGLVLGRWHTPLTGKPLIHFVHGNGFNGRVYAPLLTPLLDDFDLVMTDAQGHGESEAGGAFLGWDTNAALLAESVSEFCSSRQIASVVGMGHSFGGVMTTLMARQHASLFSRLYLLDPVFLPRPYAHAVSLLHPTGLMRYSPMVRQAAGRKHFWVDRQKAAQYFNGRGIFRSWSEASIRAYVEHGLQAVSGGVRLKAHPATEAAVFATYSRKLWPAIRKLSTPVDIIYGSRTYPFIRQGVRRASEINPLIRLHSLEGDHCFMMAEPEATANLIKRL